MYFRRFPTIYYPVTINGVKQYSVLRDITINVRLIKDFIKNITLYDLYDIQEGETPEIISEKFYDTPYYHWIIMILNERYDCTEDFPVTYDALYEIVAHKYGADKVNDIHHYENDGYVVDSTVPGCIPVTNFQYEEAQNEKKRTIKIIDRIYIEKIVNDFIALIK